jgi:hypothetical protein
MFNLTSTSIRELHSRFSDGIHVRLMWHAHDDRLWVEVIDIKRDDEFDVEVRDRARALEVFHHPFAYVCDRVAATATAGPGAEIDFRVS